MRNVLSCFEKYPLMVACLIAAFTLAFTLNGCSDGGQIEGSDEIVDDSGLFSEDLPMEAPPEEVPQPDPISELRNLLEQTRAGTDEIIAALRAQIDELKAQLEGEKNLNAEAREEMKKTIADYMKQHEELERAEDELDAALDALDEREAERNDMLNQAATDAQVAAEETAAKAVETVDIHFKVAASSSAGGTDDALTVKFCKERGNCKEFPWNSDTGTEEPASAAADAAGAAVSGFMSSVVTTVVEATNKISNGLSEGDVATMSFKGSDENGATAIDRDDLKIIEICTEGSGDDPIYIGAVMVVVNGETWYLNPSAFRMLKNSCTKFIRDEDVFFVSFIKTEDNHFMDWNNGTDDDIYLHFDVDVSKLDSDQIADIANDYQDMGGMSKKELNGSTFEFYMDSESDDFENNGRGIYGVSAPLGDAANLSEFTLIKDGTDDWDPKWVNVWAGKVADLVTQGIGYQNACYFREIKPGQLGQKKGPYDMARGDCGILKELVTRDVTGSMGTGDLAPMAWFDQPLSGSYVAEEEGTNVDSEGETASGEAVIADPRIEEADGLVMEAIRLADGIAGTNAETMEVADGTILADLFDEIELKEGLSRATDNACFDGQVEELSGREHGINLAHLRASVNAVWARVFFIDLQNALDAEEDDIADDAVEDVAMETSKAKRHYVAAEEILEKSLADACTPEEVAAAEAAAAEVTETRPPDVTAGNDPESSGEGTDV